MLSTWKRTLSLLAVLALVSTPLLADGLRFSVKRLTVDTNECCAVADFNQDGLLDISAGRNWYPAPDFEPRPLRAIGEFGKDYSENNGEHAHDVNGDGWPDIIAGSFMPTRVYVFENPGEEGLRFGKQWKSRLLVDTKLSSNEMTWLRDMDGDSTPEFVVNSWSKDNPMAYWKLGENDKSEPVLTDVIIGKNANGHGMGFGDINGDGREDVLFQDGWYERPAQESAGQLWRLHKDWHKKGASCPMLVLDLNADGRNDIIWGHGHDYGLFWEEQLEPAGDGKTRWKQHIIDKSFSQAHVVHWADLDGDGEGELISGKRVRAHSGGDPGAAEAPGIYYYEWHRAEQRFERHTIAEGHVGTGLEINTADLNGDGALDIVAPGKSGTYILFNEGDGSEPTFRPLFNGKDLGGWRPFRKARWSVKDGTVVGEHTEGHRGGWLISESTYSDFDFRFSFRVTPGANSGIAFRYPGKGSPAKTSYEMQIGDADARCLTAGIFGLRHASGGHLRAGHWQRGRIVARGKVITTYIDGRQAATIENDRSATGHLGIQVHGGKQYAGIRVEFRDIRIREF